MESVLALFLSHVGGPSSTAVEQPAENACLVDVRFGTFSQVYVFSGSVGQFGHGAGVFADSSGDFWVKAQVHRGGGPYVGQFVD